MKKTFLITAILLGLFLTNCDSPTEPQKTYTVVYTIDNGSTVLGYRNPETGNLDTKYGYRGMYIKTFYNVSGGKILEASGVCPMSAYGVRIKIWVDDKIVASGQHHQSVNVQYYLK